MTFRILTVCSANVCRSPFAQALLRRSLAGAEAPFVVTSAGENASNGHDACAVVADGHLEPGPELGTHRSQGLTMSAVESADLILAADRPSRAAVVRLQPTSHARSFTLREAAVLSAHAVSVERASYDDPVDALLALVTEMSDLRGTVEMPRPSRHRVARKPWRRIQVHGNDVPDAHKTVDAVPHSLVTRLIAENAAIVASALRDVVSDATDGTGPGRPRYALG